MDISKFANAVLMTAALGLGGQVAAQTTATRPTTASRPTGATLAIPELIQQLSTEGYSDVHDVERKSDKLYKVTARDGQGRRMELHVDARTGEVLASEEDD